MGQSAERVEQHLGAAPGWGRGRDIDYELARNLAEASVDVGFVGKLFFEEANPEARQGSFHGIELSREIHALSVRPRGTPRNLVVSKAELVR